MGLGGRGVHLTFRVEDARDKSRTVLYRNVYLQYFKPPGDKYKMARNLGFELFPWSFIYWPSSFYVLEFGAFAL